MIHEKQNAILTFWFGDDSLKPLANRKLWFGKSPDFDAAIRQRFADDLETASHGAYDDWAKTPGGALALVLLLDQFPRHVHRGEDLAFSCDELALRASQIAIARELDIKLTIVERAFLYLPFEHSEKIEVQERSVELFRTLYEETRDQDERSFITEALEYAVRHRDIIEEFGRFPHRNEILGRESTRREIEFLKKPGANF